MGELLLAFLRTREVLITGILFIFMLALYKCMSNPPPLTCDKQYETILQLYWLEPK